LLSNKKKDEKEKKIKHMKKETHISSCCREPIMLKGQGLYCLKCGSEIFNTIIMDKEPKFDYVIQNDILNGQTYHLDPCYSSGKFYEDLLLPEIKMDKEPKTVKERKIKVIKKLK